MATFIDQNGLLYFWSKIKSAFVPKETGKGLSTNDYTTTEKNKLSGIEAGANNYSLPTASSSEKGGIKVGAGLTVDANGVLSSTYGGTADSVAWSGVTGTPTTLSGYGITDVTSGAEPNQNAFSNVVVGSTTVSADAKTDTITFVSGSNVTITPDATNDKITIAATDTTYADATTSAHGLMSTTDKAKLNGIATGADVSPITEIKVNGTAQTVSSKAVNISVPTSVSQLTNDSGYLTTHQNITGKADKATTLAGYGITDAYTKSQIDSKITSTYKAGGSVVFASLPALTAANEGYVYNVTDAFTTTASFVEGAGNSYPIGTNVAIVNVGGVYKYDVMAGFVDLSNYLQTNDIAAITNSEIDTIVAS